MMSVRLPMAGRRGALVAVCLTLASMTSVQLGVSIAVPVIHEYGVLSTSSLRLWWAALVLMLFVRPPLHRYTREQWRAAFILGCGMAAMTLAFFMAVDRLPQHLAVAVEFCGPLTVAALGVRGWRAWLWPALAAFGIVLLVLGDAQESMGADTLGILYALLAAVGWGTYIVMLKRVGNVFPGLQGLVTSLLLAALITAPFAVVEVGPALFPWEQILWGAGLAVMVPLVPYTFEMAALRRLPASAFGVLMSLEPAIGALSGWIVLGQHMTLGQILGTMLVVTASIGVVRRS